MNLDDHPFACSFDSEQLRQLKENSETVRMAAGTLIFAEGSLPDALYLVLEGAVRFSKILEDSSEQDISISAEGEMFGEVGVFTGDSRALKAIANEDSLICRIPAETVKQLIPQAEPVRQILESVVRHLNSTTEHYLGEVLRKEKLALVGTMFSSLLHDFKNPVSTISLGAELIGMRNKEDAKTVKMCSDIGAQIQRMMQMANDVAAFARGESDIMRMEFPIGELFEEFEELNQQFFTIDSIEVTFEGAEIPIFADTTKLMRILQNLIGNGTEAILATKRPGAIKVSASKADESTVLTVADNGPGIPEKIQDNFFEAFVTHGKPQGTGLGSAIVKSIVDAHGGDIDFVTSDTGTTFTIRIPNAAPSE